MSAPYNNFEFVIEEILQQYIERNISIDLPIFLAMDYGHLETSMYCLILSNSITAPQEDLGGGEVAVNVAVCSTRELTRQQHKEASGHVFDLLINSGIESALNELTDEIDINLVTWGDRQPGMDNNTRITTQQIHVMCSVA